jgi:hypothetical protein
MNGQISSLQTNALYQWLLCPSLTIIPGATSVNFTPPINGEYAVIVTLANGCSDTSDCVSVGDLSIGEFDNNQAQVYPNPSDGSFIFVLPLHHADAIVTDNNGSVLLETKINSNEFIDWDLASGVYFVLFKELGLTPLRIVVR